MEVLNVTCVTY